MTDPPAESHPSWGLGDAAVGFVAGILGASVAIGVWVGFEGSDDSFGLTAAGLFGLWAGLLGTAVLVSRRKGTGSLAADFGLRFDPRADLIGVPIGVVSQLVLVPLVYLPLFPLISDLEDRLDAPSEELSDQAGTDAAFVLLAVLVIVGAPIVEELFYRGLLLRALDRRFGPRWAVGVSAAAFAVAHQAPLLIPAFLVLGVVLALMVLRWERLGPAILAHATFNAITVAVLVAERS